MTELIITFAGYLASLLLALSLLVTNDLRFRWLNTGGCLSFIVYGVLLSAWPIILTNTLLFFINVFTLVKIYRKKEAFDLLPFEPHDPIINKFIQFYADDLRNYFPLYEPEQSVNAIRFMVLRDMVIANVFMATVQEDGTAIVQCNYTVPRYRDYKVGRFIFEKEKGYLLSRGVKQLLYETVANRGHEEYLKRMGFSVEDSHGKRRYVKQL